MTVRVFEAFSGVGSQRMALRNIGVNHEVVAIAEIDIDAILSYGAIHEEGIVDTPSVELMIAELTEKNVGFDFKKGKVVLPKGDKLKNLYIADELSRNVGDISKLTLEQIPDHDLFTYSFPCQDISLAGRQRGLSEDSGTRSSLLWECRRVIEGKRPKYLLLENVKNLIGKKNRPDFDKWLEWLEGQGYTNYTQVLNAKDHGIPQNRQRVFVVSVLGVHEQYEFPVQQPLEKRLKDLLEKVIEDKYYLTEAMQSFFVRNSLNNEQKGNGFRFEPHNKEHAHIAKTITTRAGGRMDDNFIGEFDMESEKVKIDSKTPEIIIEGLLNVDKGLNDEMKRVYSPDGISPVLMTMQGGNRQPKVLIKNATKLGYLEAEHGDGVDLSYPDSTTRRGRVQKGLSQTLTTSDNLGVLEGGRIRKLTPLECWRLMGFTDEDFYKAAKVNSNTQLYKQAGNSIVVNVLEDIFRSLFK